MCSRILVFDEYLMLLLPLGVVADGDVRFKNLTYGRLLSKKVCVPRCAMLMRS